MNFSKISKVLVSFAFASMFSCGIIGAQTDDSSSEVVDKNSAVDSQDVVSSSEIVEPNKDVIQDDPASSANDSKEENKLVCENLGSFTVNSSVVKQSSHFGLFKGEDGLWRIQDITDENKNDKGKMSECKSYNVKYSCFMCYQPECEKDKNKVDSESKSDSSASEESVSDSKQEESKKEAELASNDVEVSAKS